VAVITTEGSTFAIPVNRPGPTARNNAPVPLSCGWGGSGGCGHARTEGPEDRGGLWDLWKLTAQVSFELSLVTQAQRPPIGDNPECGYGGQKQSAADSQENIRRVRFRDAGYDLRVARRDHQGERQSQHSHPGEQAGDVLRPLPGRVILCEERKSIK